MALLLYNQLVFTSHKCFDIECDTILPLRKYVYTYGKSSHIMHQILEGEHIQVIIMK